MSRKTKDINQSIGLVLRPNRFQRLDSEPMVKTFGQGPFERRLTTVICFRLDSG